MKFGIQLELYAIPEWQEQYIRYNVLKRFLSRRLTEIKQTTLAARSAFISHPKSFLRFSSASGGEPTTLVKEQSTLSILPSGLAQEPIEQLNIEFLKQLDDEMVKVERHFAFEISFLIDRLTGVQDELKVLDEEEQIDIELSAAEISEDGVIVEALTNIRHGGDEDRMSRILSTEDQSGYRKGVVSSSSSENEEFNGKREATQLPEQKKDEQAEREQRKELEERAYRRSSHRQRLVKTVVGIWDCLDKLEGFVQLNIVALYKILKKRDKLLGIKNMSVDLLEKRQRLSLLIVEPSVKDALLRLYNATSLEKDSDESLYMQGLSMMVPKHFMSAGTSVYSSWVPFFLGACSIALFDIALAAFIPPTNPSFSLSIVLTFFPIFRLSLMVALIAWGAGGALATFEYYGVNYKFILDIDPKCSVSSRTLFGLAGLLTTLWVFGLGAFLVDAKFGLFLPMNQMWVYPLLVIIGHIMICCLPSNTFRYSYRRKLINILGQTFKHGVNFYSKVNLVDNIVSDILTSLPKPVQDLEYTIVYFFGLYFLSEAQFSGIPQIDNIIGPVITFIPYWIRFAQCYSRFRNEAEDMRRIHAANMGKYFSVIIVIITSNLQWERYGLSIYASRLLFVSCYIVASLYGLVWDVVMDWGLMPDPDNFIRPNYRVLYPQWIYYTITFFNLVGRLTWAMTLVPNGILEDYRLNASLITLVISSLEILRRSAWLVLRLENEHLTNSSRYRAMLWVPKMTLNHPEVNPYIATTDAVLHQALKRFASVQAINLTAKDASKDTSKDTSQPFNQQVDTKGANVATTAG